MDNFGARHTAQYEGIEVLSTEVKGHPNIVHESKLAHSLEPTGVPLS